MRLAGSWKTQHYADGSINTLFSDCYFVTPCGRHWALTVVQAESSPLTSCPLVQILWFPDELDQSENCTPWKPGLSLLAGVLNISPL